jgi:hypothetical protein
MATISTTLKTQKATAVGTAFNGGSATLTIRTGGAPADAGAATGTLLLTISLPSTCFTTPAVAGVLSKAGTWQGTVTTGGTAGWFRILKGTDIIDGTVGTSGAELNLSSVNFVQDGVVTINTFTYTVS